MSKPKCRPECIPEDNRHVRHCPVGFPPPKVSWSEWFWYQVLVRFPITRLHISGNRAERSGPLGPVHEVTIIFRDKRIEDTYSREELVAMFQIIRDQERIQGWKVPDPDNYTINPSAASDKSLNG